MSSVSISFTPGYLFPDGDYLTSAKLRLMLTGMSIQLNGSFGTAQIEDNAVTESKLADGAVTITKIGNATFTADGNGAAPFASGFLANLYVAQKARPVASRTNVLVKNNATTPNTKADITADEVTLLDASGNYFLATAVNLTVDITANGTANGLDTLPGTGAAISTWYFIYLISNGSTVAGLISTSATAPTLPVGYTYFALVGAVYNNASSQFVTFRIQNRRAWIAETVIFNLQALTASWAAYSTNVNTAVPTIAKKMFGTIGASTLYGVGIAGDNTGLGAQYAASGGATGSTIDSFGVAAQFEIPMTASQTIYVKAAGTNAYCRCVCTGYEF